MLLLACVQPLARAQGAPRDSAVKAAFLFKFGSSGKNEGELGRPVEIGIDAVNLFNRSYADTEYAFVSDWRTGDVPSQLPTKHLSAGAPLTVLGTATFRF